MASCTAKIPSSEIALPVFISLEINWNRTEKAAPFKNNFPQKTGNWPLVTLLKYFPSINDGVMLLALCFTCGGLTCMTAFKAWHNYFTIFTNNHITPNCRLALFCG